MGADQVSYHGRFKDKKRRYKEIRNVLINDFIKLDLEPDEGFGFEYSEIVEGWKTLFEEKEDYLELEIDNCFGNYGYALDYIENEFIKKFNDVMVEFAVEEFYDGVSTERIRYDGKTIEHGEPPALEEDHGSPEETKEMDNPFIAEIACPKCGNPILEILDECTLCCPECDEELGDEDFEDGNVCVEDLYNKAVEENGGEPHDDEYGDYEGFEFYLIK